MLWMALCADEKVGRLVCTLSHPVASCASIASSKAFHPRCRFHRLAWAAVSQFSLHPVCLCFAGSSPAHSCWHTSWRRT